MLEFLWQYIIGPIVAEAVNGVATWNGVEAVAGYNLYNTVAWALLAILMISGVRKLFEKQGIELTPTKAVQILPVIFLGGLLRFVQDSQELNFYLEIMLITPIIYIWLGTLAAAFIYLNSKRDISKYFYTLIGIVTIYSITLLPPMNIVPLLGVFIATAVVSGIYYYLTEGTKYNSWPLILAAASQFFEAFSSMYALTQSFEARQVLTSFFVETFGPAGFLAVKIGVLAVSLKIYFDLETEWKSILLIALYSIGFATGLRVLLRAVTGI